MRGSAKGLGENGPRMRNGVSISLLAGPPLLLLACASPKPVPAPPANVAPAGVYPIPHTDYRIMLPPYPGMADVKKGGFLVWEFAAAGQKGEVTVHFGSAYETALDDTLAAEIALGRRRLGPVRGRHLGIRSAYWELERSTSSMHPDFYEKRTYELLKRGDKGLVEVYYQYHGPPELAGVAWTVYGPVFRDLRCSLRLQSATAEPEPSELEESCPPPPK